jgi:hypothetical protein
MNDLDDLKAALAKMTPGEWRSSHVTAWGARTDYADLYGPRYMQNQTRMRGHAEDVDGIVALVNAAPALIARLEQAEAAFNRAAKDRDISMGKRAELEAENARLKANLGLEAMGAQELNATLAAERAAHAETRRVHAEYVNEQDARLAGVEAERDHYRKACDALRERWEKMRALVKDAYDEGQSDCPDDKYYGQTGRWKDSNSKQELAALDFDPRTVDTAGMDEGA